MAPATEITPTTVSDSTSDNDHDISKTGAHTTAVSDSSVESPEERKKTSLWRRIVGLVWDSVDNPDPEYRRYVQRLDRIFL